MKVNKLITIDYEIMLKLQKESNASGLINSMLIKHYKDVNKTEEEIIEEVKKLASFAEAFVQEYQKLQEEK